MANRAALLFCLKLNQNDVDFARALFEHGLEIWANAGLYHSLQAHGIASHRVDLQEHMSGIDTLDTPTNRKVLAHAEIPFFELVYAPLQSEAIDAIQDATTVDGIFLAQGKIGATSCTILLKAIEGGRIVVSCPGQFKEVLSFLGTSGLSETERMRMRLRFALVATEALHDQMEGFAGAIQFQIERLGPRTGMAVSATPATVNGDR